MYLEEYLDKVNYLPVDVNRYLNLIKQLDIRVNSAQAKLEKLQEDYLMNLK
jgi:hypothetical protein